MSNTTFRRYSGYSPNQSWPGSHPAIHETRAQILPVSMDARNKSGHDEEEASRRVRNFVRWRKLAALLAVAMVICAVIGAERAGVFRGGFGGFHGGFGGFHGGFGGFHGGFGGFHDGSFAGGSRFGDGSFADRSTDAGFG